MSYDIVIKNTHKALKNIITENVSKWICTLVSFQADFAVQIALKLENPGGSRLVSKKIVRDLPQDRLNCGAIQIFENINSFC